MTQLQTSYCHRGGEPPLLGATIPEHFATIVERFPAREAVVSLPQQRRLTYDQLAQAVDQLALGLLGSGFAKGSRIAIWSTNNIEWLLLQLATARIGASPGQYQSGLSDPGNWPMPCSAPRWRGCS